MRAEHPPEDHLVAPNLWATLSVHVVASPGSHAALEVGGLTVHSFFYLSSSISSGQRRRRRCPQPEVREPSALLTPS